MVTEPARRPVLVAANVLLTAEREILMGLREDCLMWEVPGGKVDAESLVDAARREQREETGMTLTGNPEYLGFADTWEHWGVNGEPWFVVQFFLWRTWTGFPQLCEGKHATWRWVSLDAMPRPEQVTCGTRMAMETIFRTHPDLLVPKKVAEAVLTS